MGGGGGRQRGRRAGRAWRGWRVVGVVGLTVTTAGCGLVPFWGGGHARPRTATVLTSTADAALRLQESDADLRLSPRVAPTVEVHLDRPRQELAGVGAALTDASAHLIAGLPAPTRHRLLSALFDPRRGGLGVVRIVIGASDFSRVHASLDDSPVPDPDLTRFTIDADRAEIIPVLREILAIAPRVQIVASPWSAPAWMKDTGSYLYGRLLPEYEDAYARYLVRFLQAYRAAGVPVRWLTVQNEPAAIQLTYPSMLMDAEQQARLIHDDLGPALAQAGLDPQVLVWDHNWCDARPPGGCAGPAPASFPLEVLRLTGAAPPVGGTAFHCYGGDQATANEAVHAAWPTLAIWQTECSGGEWQGPRPAAFAQTATLVLEGWNHWANAELLWNLALDPDHGPHLGGCDTCRGVVTVDPATGAWTPELDRDVLATFGWAGGRGSRVLETSVDPASGLGATALCDPRGHVGVVVLNPGDATTATIGIGALAVQVRAPTQSLTAVRVPRVAPCARRALPPRS